CRYAKKRYAARAATNTTPMPRASPTDAAAAANSSDAASTTPPSRLSARLSTAIGRSSAAAPRISRMFAIFEPTMLPTAMPGEPTSAACTLVTSSGVEVPKPTSVSPIRSGDTPKHSAVRTAPRTRSSAPTTSSARPAAKSSAAVTDGRSASGIFGRPFEHPLDVTGQQIDLDVHRRAGPVVSDDRRIARMRHDVDAEAVARDLVHGQAHAVDGDRALARDVTREPGGQIDRDDERPGRRLDRGHARDAVDVAADEMAVERVAERKRRLEIHARAVREQTERRHRQRLA